VSWEDAWREGRTRWDAGGPAPALVEALRDEFLPSGNALVTGCGSGYDVFALAESGRSTTGLDMAPTAAKRFEQLRRERGIQPAMARVALADFFTWNPGRRFDVVWDYTFCCALPPSQRHRWGYRMSELVAPEGRLATLVFPMAPDAPRDQGPPFPLFPEDVAAALPGWTVAEERTPTTSHPGREGMERLILWRPPT